MNAAVTEEPVDPSDELMFLCLGGGNEVGRSCHIIQYKGKTVMVSRRDASKLLRRTRLIAITSSTPASIPPTMVLPRCRSTTTLISALSTCSLSASKRTLLPPLRRYRQDRAVDNIGDFVMGRTVLSLFRVIARVISFHPVCQMNTIQSSPFTDVPACRPVMPSCP